MKVLMLLIFKQYEVKTSTIDLKLQLHIINHFNVIELNKM